MKKILKMMMLVCALMLAIALPGLAEGAAQTAQAYDWAGLGTVAGATAAVLMIVQYIKAPLDRVWKIPTRLLVYAVALALMLLAQGFSGGGLTVESALLAAVNAVMVALSAYGAYEMTFKKTEEG